jgi:phosphate transport system substrate-binding protein
MQRNACARLLCALCLILALLATARQAHAAELVVGGTGSAGPLVEILFAEYGKQRPDVPLRLVAPPLGSNGALRAMAKGRVHLVFAGRPLTKEELSEFGQHFDLADTPFVMASKDGQRARGFTLDEVAQVYEGSLTKWDNGAPIRLILRGAFESDTLLLKSMSTSLSKAQDAARARPGMSGGVNDIETVLLLQKTNGSFGPTTLGLLTTMGVRLQLFPLNGVTPSTANLKVGKYPWHKKITIILPRNPSPEAADFVRFLRSAKARELLLRNDYLPVAP